MDEKKVEFSIDKLTILGRLKRKEYYYEILDQSRESFVPFFEKNIDSCFYSKSFKVQDLGFLQIDSATLNFRLEFNPNKLTELSNLLLNILLSYVTDYHFSRIDLAIDLYNYDLYNYNIVDLIPRKKAFYYDRVGRLETCYFGSMSSNKFIRIYNKAVEQKEPNKDWWRVELQLRDDYIDVYLDGLKDFLDGVYIFKYVSLDSYDVNEKAMIEYLLKDISRLSGLSKNGRTKYRKILKELKIESLTFINSLMQCSFEYVSSYLNKLCPIIYSDKLTRVLNSEV